MEKLKIIKKKKILNNENFIFHNNFKIDVLKLDRKVFENEKVFSHKNFNLIKTNSFEYTNNIENTNIELKRSPFFINSVNEIYKDPYHHFNKLYLFNKNLNYFSLCYFNKLLILSKIKKNGILKLIFLKNCRKRKGFFVSLSKSYILKKYSINNKKKKKSIIFSLKKNNIKLQEKVLKKKRFKIIQKKNKIILSRRTYVKEVSQKKVDKTKY